MKFLVVLVLCTFACANAQDKKKELMAKCMQELGLSKEDFKKSEDGSIPENAKCLAKCILEKVGVMSNGELVEGKVEEECKSAATGSDACEIANNYIKCWRSLKKKKE